MSPDQVFHAAALSQAQDPRRTSCTSATTATPLCGLALRRRRSSRTKLIEKRSVYSVLPRSRGRHVSFRSILSRKHRNAHAQRQSDKEFSHDHLRF
jgi:hypothetical protein